RAIQVTQWETAFGVICVLAGLFAFGTDRNWRTFSLCILLMWQGSLYLAAPLYSLLSLRREAALGAAPPLKEQGKPVMEQWAARWVMAFSMVMIGAFSLIRFLPLPTGLPDYTRFLPQDPAAEVGSPIASEPATEIAAQPTLEMATAPVETPTLVLTGATATVTVDSANCRDRPRPGGDRVTYVYRSQVLEIVGKNGDLVNPWWYVKLPDSSNYCWLWGMTVQLTGATDGIPIVP
ncbi:MAG: hypothetical protein M3Y68_02855, partial [Chloroflexota bacterium]|nr:hypothetical protein [Chloroflexota bacterium]